MVGESPIEGGNLIVGNNSPGILNLSGTGQINIQNHASRLILANSDTLGIVNLGGTSLILTPGVTKGVGVGILNFNGGGLYATTSNTSFLQDLTACMCIPLVEGSTTAAQPLKLANRSWLPRAREFRSVPAAISGSGWVAPPVIDVVGGGGTGATAVATIDVLGNLTGMTITNPGVNYTSVPTFFFHGGGGTLTATGAPVLTSNVGGGLTFSGNGSTLLRGFNTYSGSTNITAGTLTAAAGAAIPDQSDVTVAANATFSIKGDETIGSLAGAGNVSIDTQRTLTSGGATTNTSFSGSISGLAGSKFVKIGAGTLNACSNEQRGSASGNRRWGRWWRMERSRKMFKSTASAALRGSGSIQGAVTAANNSTVSPGDALGVSGVLTFGSLNLGALATTSIELGGTTRGTQYDAVSVTNSAARAGTLSVSLVNGFAPAIGNSFDIFDWSSATGAFAAVNLPSLVSGLAWDKRSLYTSGLLSVIDASFLPGDLNRDQQVNGADLPAMLKALTNLTAYQATNGLGGGALTDQQFLQLADFNADNKITNADIQGLINYLSNGLGSGSLTAVPEPTSCCLAAIGAASIAFIRSRSKDRLPC